MQRRHVLFSIIICALCIIQASNVHCVQDIHNANSTNFGDIEAHAIDPWGAVLSCAAFLTGLSMGIMVASMIS